MRSIIPDLPDWVDKSAWADFEQHRASLRKPLTILSAKKNLAVLRQHRDRQRQIVDQAIARAWAGLSPPQGDDDGKPRSAVDRVDAANGGRQQI